MVIPQYFRLRSLLGWLAAALLLAALVCLVDGLTTGLKGNALTVQAIPGESHPLTGPMPAGASTLPDVRVTGTDNDVQLVLEGLQTGYWLGGAMWRASVNTAPNAAPGERTLLLEGPLLTAPPQAAIILKVEVFRNAKARQQASSSFIMRHTGRNAFIIAAVLFAAALPLMGGIFLIGWRMEAQLVSMGLAPIYIHKHTAEEETITFSMGLRQGLAPGMVVGIVNTSGQTLGQAEVIACRPDDATARVIQGTVPQEAYAGIPVETE